METTSDGFENKSPAIQNLIKKMSPHPESFEGQSKCAICGNSVKIETDFKDALSKKEWTISHMCQDCQDGVFEA